jgi:hypothetical protein
MALVVPSRRDSFGVRQVLPEATRQDAARRAAEDDAELPLAPAFGNDDVLDPAIRM